MTSKWGVTLEPSVLVTRCYWLAKSLLGTECG
jgi:hypothetical protein